MKDAIICFTRVPVPGHTKTRLMPLLAKEQCAELHTAFLYDISEVCGEFGCDTFICFEEGAGWQTLRGIFPYAVSMLPQRGDGLGERMYNAIRSVLAMGYGKCVLIGSDIPEITVAHLQSGFDALESADVTLGPTEDGGYYLVGMKKPNKAVFEKQEYGTDSVYDNAVAAVKEAGLSFAPAMMCRDVDTPQDLMELKKRLCGKSSRTAQCIDKIL